MARNAIGWLFRITTFSESHGLALGCIVDGVPPGIPLTEADLQYNLDRRHPGTSRYTTRRRKPNQVEILSGVSEGITTDTDIELLIENTDQRPRDHGTIKDVFRSGHTGYTYEQKYGLRDCHGGGRSFTHEIIICMAAGTIAEKYLAEKFGIEICGCPTQMGDIPLEIKDWSQVEQNPFFCPGPDKVDTLDELVHTLRKGDDSVGAKVTAVASGVPIELDEPVFDRLDADIAHTLMSIDAVKDVEVGDGFDTAALHGSQNHDEIIEDGFRNSHVGGILGDISSGQQIVTHMALKPASSIIVPGHTINRLGEEVGTVTRGRHDPCVGIHAVPIAGAMLVIVLVDHLLRQRAQNVNVKTDIPRWQKMNKTVIVLLALLAGSASLAATPWQKITQPTPGGAQSVGSFFNGCIVGADALPIQSERYQVMHTDQYRYFEHPDLTVLIRRPSHQASNLGMGTVLTDDMGMPADGRFSGGHASHQAGPGINIFLQLPKARWTFA